MHRSGFVEIFGNELTEVIGNEPNRKLFRATWEVADIIENRESLALSHGVNPNVFINKTNGLELTVSKNPWGKPCAEEYAKKLLGKLHKLMPANFPVSGQAIDEEARLLFPALYATFSDEQMASYIKLGIIDKEQNHAQIYIAGRQNGKSIKQALFTTFQMPNIKHSILFHGAILAAACAAAIGLSTVKSCQAGKPNHPAVAHLITKQNKLAHACLPVYQRSFE